DRVHRRGGRTTSDGGAAEAFRQVRADDPPGQDATGAVRAAPGAEWTGGAGVGEPARDVRLPGVHPLLGEVQEEQRGGQETDGSQPSPPVRESDRGMVSAQPAPTDPGAARDAEPETARPRRLLRGDGELLLVEPYESDRGADLAEVAFSAQLE